MRLIPTKILLWTSMVYVLSFICYLPMLMNQLGFFLPAGMLNLKYLYIFIPATITVWLMGYEHNLKIYFIQLFSKKFKAKEFSVCFMLLLLGILISFCYYTGTGVDLFRNAYPSLKTFIINCFYLTFTGFIEEVAWRGYYLERVSMKRKSIGAVLFVGVVWAVWHLPMWVIRNSSSIEEIILLLVWTVVVSIALGWTYYKYKNILVVSILHMIFNTCFLAPIQYNIVVLTFIYVIGIFVIKVKHIEL